MRDETHQSPHLSQDLDRRDLLKGFIGAAALTAMPQAALAETAKEPPALAELVSGGKLPALAERVSASPMVVKVDKVGRYGGALRRGLRGSSDHNGILRMVGNQGLGFMISYAGQTFATDQLLAGVVVIAVAGMVLSLLAERVQRRFQRWRANDGRG